MASFGCYDNSDVIATRIITNFHLYLIQLWWQFSQMFVYGVLVYAQKNFTGIDPEKLYRATFIMLVRPMLLHRMALVSVRLFCKNLGNLQEFFWANGLPPPLAKNPPYAYVYTGMPVVRMDGHSVYDDMITKFSRMGRFT